MSACQSAPPGDAMGGVAGIAGTRPPDYRTLALALAVSLALHAGFALVVELLLRAPAPERSRRPEILSVRLESLRPVPRPADPPQVLKDTLREAPAPEQEAPPPPKPRKAAAREPGVAEVRLRKPEALPEDQLAQTLERLSETLLYPQEAVQLGLEGEVVLLLDLGDGGGIRDVSVASSSGHAILDEAALRAALRLGGLGAAAAGKSVLLPVRFRLL